MPESEDEYAVINEVDILVTKIKRAEIHFDTEMEKQIRTRITAHESLEVRTEKRQSRVTNLQNFLDASNDGISGLSGGPPAALVVIAS